MVRLEARKKALRWGAVGLCWNAKKGTFEGGIPKSTVLGLVKAGLLYEDGAFHRLTPAGRRALGKEQP